LTVYRSRRSPQRCSQLGLQTRLENFGPVQTSTPAVARLIELNRLAFPDAILIVMRGDIFPHMTVSET